MIREIYLVTTLKVSDRLLFIAKPIDGGLPSTGEWRNDTSGLHIYLAADSIEEAVQLAKKKFEDESTSLM